MKKYINWTNTILILLTTAYLIYHYFLVRYPPSISSSASFCNLNSFFNCDAATFSGIANIKGIPLASFGFFFGLLLLANHFFKDRDYKQLIKVIINVNLLGCLTLLTYSIFILKSICPICSIYYLLSGFAVFLNKSYSSWSFNIKKVIPLLLVFLVINIPLYLYSSYRSEAYNKNKNQVIIEYLSLNDEKDPYSDSPYLIHKSTEKFSEAKIRISVFSDFQCPYCKQLADQMDQVKKRYEKFVNIQYFFYPLDPICNANVKNSMHLYACKAAMLAACNPEKFPKIHDQLFSIQEYINDGSLDELSKQENLSGCLQSREVLNNVIESINVADQYQLKSTPTVIINGKKIEGVLSDIHLFSILDYILRDNVK